VQTRQKLKFLTGWSNPGGSTECILDLASELSASHPSWLVEVYGPHTYHLDIISRCSGDKFPPGMSGFHSEDFIPEPTDIVVAHFVTLPKLNVRKQVYWCHEQGSFMHITDSFLDSYDSCVFVSTEQAKTHSVTLDNKYRDTKIVIPNLVFPRGGESGKPRMVDVKVAGVIGSIDENKQTHKSIERALRDGVETILLFGLVTDGVYFETFVRPYIDSGKVQYCGQRSRMEIYTVVDKVYHSSRTESFGMVYAECKALGIPYDGPPTPSSKITTFGKDYNKKIIGQWKNVLSI
jgi:hypothetical protein